MTISERHGGFADDELSETGCADLLWPGLVFLVVIAAMAVLMRLL